MFSPFIVGSDVYPDCIPILSMYGCLILFNDQLNYCWLNDSIDIPLFPLYFHCLLYHVMIFMCDVYVSCVPCSVPHVIFLLYLPLCSHASNHNTMGQAVVTSQDVLTRRWRCLLPCHSSDIRRWISELRAGEKKRVSLNNLIMRQTIIKPTGDVIYIYICRYAYNCIHHLLLLKLLMDYDLVYRM